MTAEMIVHLGRISYADDPRARLSSAQWMALRFFSCANRLSKSPSAFAVFHGTTRGTASQTIKSLVSAGYLERRPTTSDGRGAIFDLTPAGERMLEHDRLQTLKKAIETLPLGLRRALALGVQRLASQIAGHCDSPTFGACRNCRHLTTKEIDSVRRPHCGYADIALADDEMDRLCVVFKLKTKLSADGI